jgi:dTDP-4-amino-4,6-dideoxygalactose transaminase
MKFPFGTISIPQKTKALIQEILDTNRVSSGKYVREFESKFAELIGTKEAVAVSSGTDALALALAVLYDFGAQRGDEIILPALSFAGTGNAVLQAGFKPVFVDVRRETLNIDPAKIESAITNNTRAILPVHLMGKPAQMDTINSVAKKHNLLVIEDAAEAYGTEYRDQPAGTLAAMGCFSLYVAHIITAVEGGMVVTDNPQYAEIIRSLRAHGRACKCKKCVSQTVSGHCEKRFQYGKDIRFIFERVGYSSKMNELEAAVGLGQLEEYDKTIRTRRKNLYYLMKEFKQFAPYLTTLEEEPHQKFGPHAFAVIVGEGSKVTRDELVYYLGKKGIDPRSLFCSMPTQCRGFKYLGYKLGDFPNAEYIGNNGFHIGVHQNLTKEHLDYFLTTVGDFLAKGVKK